MDHALRWLLDVVMIAAWIYLRPFRDLGLDPQPITPVTPLPVRPPIGGVAVLVSQPGMRKRVRRALGGRTVLYFASTWDELEQIVVRASPCAILADPMADKSRSPHLQLARFSKVWRIPVVLYTQLTPAAAETLVEMGDLGIRHVIFNPFDDSPDRFIDTVPLGGNQPPAPLAA